jgi:hypothetical protein
VTDGTLVVARDEAEKAVVEAHTAELVGGRIAAVRYVGLDVGVPLWSHDGRDSLDFGTELDMSDGTTWSITRVPPGFNTSLALVEQPLSLAFPQRTNCASWDMTEASGWASLLGHPIVDTDTTWFQNGWLEPDGQQRSSDWCCGTIVLGFGVAGKRLLRPWRGRPALGRTCSER